MLRPRDVEVFQQDPPRHRIDGQVVNDQRELTGFGHPQRAQHRPGARVQPRPRRQHRFFGHRVHRRAGGRGIHRPRLGHGQRPATGAVVVDSQPQHGVPIQQGLQHDRHIGLGDTRGSLHHNRLVELLDRAVNALQPADDRGCQHRPDALVNRTALTAGHTGHQRQPGHGLLDEDVARPARQAGGPGPRHDLHRQDAVAAQLEEGVVDADAIQAEDLGVDAGQDFLDRVARGAISIGIPILGGGQRSPVEFAVGRQRQLRAPPPRRAPCKPATAGPARRAPVPGRRCR